MRTRRAAPPLAVLLATTALALVPPPAGATEAAAGPGDVFPGFVTIGGEPATSHESVTDVAEQSTGMLVIAQQTAAGAVLRRLHPDGRPDPTFGVANGATVAMTQVDELLVLPDDRIVTAGRDLRRYTATGALDASFGADGIVEIDEESGYWNGASPKALLHEPDGDVVVVGQAYHESGDYDVFAQRWLPDGTVDSGFRSDHSTYWGSDVALDNLAYGALPDGAGGYVVLGKSAPWTDLAPARSWHLRSDSTTDGEPVVLDQLPPSRGWTWIPGLTADHAYVVGTGLGGPYLARLELGPTGLVVDTDWFASGPVVPVPAWAAAGTVQADGKIVLATHRGLMRLHPDGRTDPAMTSSPSALPPSDSVMDVLAGSDGGIVVAGFRSAPQATAPWLRKYVGRMADVTTSTSHTPVAGLTQTVTITYRSTGPDPVGRGRLAVETPAGTSSRLTPSQGSCAGSGTTFVCSLGAVAAASGATVHVTTTSTASLTGTLVATGTSELFDPDTADQRSTATITASTPSAATPAAGTALTVVRRPVVKGTPRVGLRLRATTGTWSARPSSYRFQWLRGGKAVKKATGRTYRLTRKDRGKKVAVRVTALRTGHTSGVATSRAVRVRGGTARTAAKVAAGPPVRGRLIASPPEVGPGQAILLTGVAGGHIPRRVVLQLRTSDGWSSLQRKLTREGGLFRFTHRAPDAAGVLAFRVRVPAAPHIGGDLSVTPTRRVLVTT